MSLAGPVLSIQPTVSQHTSPLMQSSTSGGSPTGSLLGIPLMRERANSESDVRVVTENMSLPPSALITHTQSLNAPSGSLSPMMNRCISMPRGDRAVSVGPNGQKVSRSPRFMKRAETIDTHRVSREEREDHMQLNQYKVLDIIGQGSYGIVRKAMSLDTDETYAMKIVGKGRLKKKGGLGRPPPRGGPRRLQAVKTPLDDLKREIAILKKLDHPNVVRLLEVLDDPSEDDLILVMEYLPNGPVISKLPMESPFSEDQARDYFIDMVLGLEYLHSQHVIHRDIKPMNLLLDDENRIKIADFGVSEEIERTESNLSRWAGTPAFVAPECLDGSKTSFQGQPVDIWAAGVTLYCFVLGKVPWSPPSIVDLYEQIKTEDPPLPDSLPESLKDLIRRLLWKDQKQRITIPEIREHPWILKSSKPLPTKEENCNAVICVSDEDMNQAFKPYRTPIHILAMIQQMAKRRSLRRPFSPKTTPTSSPASSPVTSPRHKHEQEKSILSERSIKSSGGSVRKREKFASTHNAPPIVVDSVDDVHTE